MLPFRRETLAVTLTLSANTPTHFVLICRVKRSPAICAFWECFPGNLADELKPQPEEEEDEKGKEGEGGREGGKEGGGEGRGRGGKGGGEFVGARS